MKIDFPYIPDKTLEQSFIGTPFENIRPGNILIDLEKLTTQEWFNMLIKAILEEMSEYSTNITKIDGEVMKVVPLEPIIDYINKRTMPCETGYFRKAIDILSGAIISSGSQAELDAHVPMLATKQKLQNPLNPADLYK